MTSYKRTALEKLAQESPDDETSLWDVLSNTGRALWAGQLPIPWMTIGDKFENKPIEVPEGEPVYIGMAGADPSSQSDFAESYANNKFTFKRQSPKNNTLMFRWFDRSQAQRAIEKYRKTHPVYVLGESYGGSAAADAVSGAEGQVNGLVMYDPVGHAGVTAPKNLKNPAVNIQPLYRNSWSPGNLIARIGGRNPEIEGANRKEWYGNYRSGPESTNAHHWYSDSAVSKAIDRLAEGDGYGAKPDPAVLAKAQVPNTPSSPYIKGIQQ